MRQIKYIFIDSDCKTNSSKSGSHDVSNLRYHYVVNSQGCIINPTPVQLTTKLIDGPIYDPEKYNKCSIFVRYNGNLNSNDILGHRTALLDLLVELRQHFPDAKILGVSELDGRELYCKNIIVSDAMNVLRRELSDLP